jgi:transcriptional regulator GlxA family with amidase domain
MELAAFECDVSQHSLQPLLTLDEVAKLARVTERTLRRRIAEGTGPTITRIANKPLVTRSHYASWIARHAEDRAA